MPGFRRKVREGLHEIDKRGLFDTVEEIAEKFRSYIAVTALMSLITGVASALWAFAVGLDLALV